MRVGVGREACERAHLHLNGGIRRARDVKAIRARFGRSEDALERVRVRGRNRSIIREIARERLGEHTGAHERSQRGLLIVPQCTRWQAHGRVAGARTYIVSPLFLLSPSLLLPHLKCAHAPPHYHHMRNRAHENKGRRTMVEKPSLGSSGIGEHMFISYGVFTERTLLVTHSVGHTGSVWPRPIEMQAQIG